MNATAKKRLVAALLVALVELNVASLAALWWGRPVPPHESGAGAGGFIERELKLSDEQKEQYLELRHQHRRATGAVRREMHRLRQDFFALMQDGSGAAEERGELARQIGLQQSELEQITFDHFAQLRALCTPEQVEAFDRVVGRALQMLSGPPGHPPPKGGERGGVPPHLGGPPPKGGPPR